MPSVRLAITCALITGDFRETTRGRLAGLGLGIVSVVGLNDVYCGGQAAFDKRKTIILPYNVGAGIAFDVI